MSTRNPVKTSRDSRSGGLFRVPREVISELKKTTWPSKEESRRLTVMVLVVSAVMGVILGFADFVFSKIFSTFFLNV